MSSYIAKTKHPITGKWKNAFWIDDYFGRHQYGVIFFKGRVRWENVSCDDNKEIEVFDPEKIKIETK